MAAQTHAVFRYFVVHATGKARKYDVESCNFCDSAFQRKGCGRDELTYHLIGRAGSATSSSSEATATTCSKVLPQRAQNGVP
jgi:hypothetical protein